MPLLLNELDGDVRVLTLNRPEAMNALSLELRQNLHDAVAKAEAVHATSVIVITGAGDRAFCAGLDLKETDPLGLTKTSVDPASLNPVQRITACTKPTIAAVNGVAITGGLELALACDIMVASSNARFADTHVRVGVMPGWGLSQALARRIGLSRAKELSLSGNFLDAETGAAWGLVNRVLPEDELLACAVSLARDIASCDQKMVRGYRALINEGYDLAYRDGKMLEAERSEAHNSLVAPASILERLGGIENRGRSQTR